MEKIDIKSLSKAALEKELVKLGAEGYRATQIFKWLYERDVIHLGDMTDIPLDLRKKLKARFHMTHPTILDTKRSLIDGTTKYLIKLEDANTIEAVFLPEADRVTICLSTQVGCKHACSFCASAPFGFVRNLKCSEILDEVLILKRANPKSRITNLVFMGIGEPLDNYANVMSAIRIFNDRGAFDIGARKITVSTCGIIPGIEKLKAEGIQVELSVSLHSADDVTRTKLIPVNKRYPVADLIEACRDYTKTTGRIITFEYILIKGVNASRDDAVKLAKLLRGLNCKVNTISYNMVNPVRDPNKTHVSNGVKALGYQQPEREDSKAFVETLKSQGVNAIHRRSKGEDIDAGCGQLRISKL